MAKATRFSITDRPVGKAIFRNLPGWKFDEGVWVHPDETNQNFKLPLKSDLDLSSIPSNFYRSGVVGQEDLELEELNFENERLLTGWTPGVRRGQYFSHEEEHNLHGSESIIVLVADETDDDNRSYVDLNQAPHPLLPVTAEYLTRDPETLAVTTGDKFKKVAVFKGVASNGRELDGNEPSNTDHSVLELRVIRQDSEPEEAVPLLVTDVTVVAAGIYEVVKVSGVLPWYAVKFSRPDIFRRELTFETFVARQVNPAGNGALLEGDYCISYKGHWAERKAMRVALSSPHADYGVVSYKPERDVRVLFNQDVRIPSSQTFGNLNADTTFHLSEFPILDLTSYRDGDFAGPIQLDGVSLSLAVDGSAWTRVLSLDDAAAADEVFELDPLHGIIRFGDGGITQGGALPVGEIVATYTQVPLIQYDTLGSRELFDDPGENLDPQVNALKRGFLVLDNRRLMPWRIELSAVGPTQRAAGFCCYGPLGVPAASVEDLLPLRARVIARGNPAVGVPNVPVRFESADGLVVFSQEAVVTDGDGYARTEASGISLFNNFVVADWIYQPMDLLVEDYLNPDPADGDLVAEAPEWGAHISDGNTLTFGERFTGDVDSVYLLIQSIPADTVGNMLDYSGDPVPADEYLDPYNSRTRLGGVTVVWHRTIDGAEEIVHPVSATPNGGNPEWTDFEFPINVPTGHLIVAYKIVIDRRAEVVAHTTEDPLLTSNAIKICLGLNEQMRGQWKLPNLLEPEWDGFVVNPPEVPNLDSSRISSAVYMSPNDFEVTEIQPAGGGAPIGNANVGDGIDIVGTSFPTTEELYVSVYIVKVDANNEIVAVRDISDDVEFVNATTIRIASLPVPPTGEYDVNYWIAVGGFHPEDPVTSARKTAALLEIGAAL